MKQFSTEIKWTVIITVVSLVWIIIEKIIGLHDAYIGYHSMVSSAFTLPYIGMLYLALKEKKEKVYAGKMLWRDGFTSGMILCIMIATLAPIVQMIMHQIISPDYFGNMIQYATEHRIMNPEEAKAYFNSKTYAMQSVFIGFMMGIFVCGLISIYLTRKPKQQV